jgi:DNA-binding transcriptional LysR family regulator
MNAAKLEHVVAIDRCESITAAAKSLNLTQSTVSRSLADIEGEVGYALFDRRARGVVATERGRVFLNRAARIISDLGQLEKDARASRESEETLIRVGVSPASLQGLINKAIRRLIHHHTELRVHLEAVSAGAGLRVLRRGDVDILVGPENALSGDADIAFERLGELRTRLFARKKHPLALKTRVAPEEIAAYPLVSPDRLSWHADRLHELFAGAAEDSFRRMHIVEYFPLIAELVAAGDAIGVVSAEYAASKSFSRRFSLLNVPMFEPLPVGMAVRRRWQASPAMRAFQSALREFPPGG